MAIQREIERNGLLSDEILGYESLESPMWFGPEGQEPERTFITDEPLRITISEYEMLSSLAQKVTEYISSYSLEENSAGLGFNPQYLKDSLLYDNSWGGRILYGGLDVYIDGNGEPKVLEINSRVQAMGLQDARLDYLGIDFQPKMINQFVDRLQENRYEKIVVLGSRKNPFWRSHLRLARTIESASMQCVHCPTEAFGEILESGFVPDVIIRKCSSSHILYSSNASKLREAVLTRQIPFINSLSSTFYGDRGFLGKIAEDLPDLFPEQVELGIGSSEEEFREYPWLKLETGDEFAYVVNFNRLRKWARDGVVSLVRRDFEEFEATVGEKTNRDATRLKRVKEAVCKIPEEQVKWIAQRDVDPPSVNLTFNGEPQTFSILHRVYWVNGLNGEVSVSLEGFGCTEKQFSQSKGKINAGTGVSVPMVIE